MLGLYSEGRPIITVIQIKQTQLLSITVTNFAGVELYCELHSDSGPIPVPEIVPLLLQQRKSAVPAPRLCRQQELVSLTIQEKDRGTT